MIIGCAEIEKTNAKPDLNDLDQRVNAHMINVASGISSRYYTEAEPFATDEIAAMKEGYIKGDEYERMAIVDEMGERGGKEGLDLLLQAANDEDALIRRQVIDHLGNHAEDERALKTLINALSDKDNDVVLEALESLSEILDFRVRDAFLQLKISHSNQLIREIAGDYAEQLIENIEELKRSKTGQ